MILGLLLLSAYTACTSRTTADRAAHGVACLVQRMHVDRGRDRLLLAIYQAFIMPDL